MTEPALFAAIEFAARAHRGQYRKGSTVPYIVHPMRVGQLLIEAGAPPEVVIAGLLHDTIEDTQVSAADIAADFGQRVIDLVLAVSEPDREATWETRKRGTIEHLAAAAPAVRLLVCADKLDNVRAMMRGEQLHGSEFWSRFHRPKAKQAWYYRGVAAALRCRASAPALLEMLARLDDAVAALFGPLPAS